jgi:hypothetical protein
MTLAVGEQPGPDLPLEWKSNKTISSRDLLSFRWSTTARVVGSARWIVTGSDRRFVVATGQLQTIPAPGKSSDFSIAFAQFAPATPPAAGIIYEVKVRTTTSAAKGKGKGKGKVAIETSPAVIIMYVPPAAPVKFEDEPIEPTFIPAIKLRFEGLWCVEESNEVGDDEIAFLAAMFFDNGDGQTLVQSAIVPPAGEIEEIATGDTVKRSDEFFWNPACELSVLIVLTEHDHSDGSFMGILEDAVLAAAAHEMNFGTRAKDMAGAVVSSVPDYIVTNGLNDDEIFPGKVAVSWTKTQLLATVNGAPWTSPPFTANFQTVHKWDGAEYRLYFRVLKA